MLTEYREKIDELDREIMKLLAQRLNVAQKIVEVKKQQQTLVKDEKREQAVLDNIKIHVEDTNLVQFVTEIYKKIIKTSCQIQENML